MSPSELTERLGLSMLHDRLWFVQPSCATTGEGLAAGLQWLSKAIPDLRV